MSTIPQLITDCQEEVEPGFIPPRFARLVVIGTDLETAADIVTTTVQATREKKYGEQAESLTMVLGWTYGPDIA